LHGGIVYSGESAINSSNNIRGYSDIIRTHSWVLWRCAKS